MVLNKKRWQSGLGMCVSLSLVACAPTHSIRYGFSSAKWHKIGFKRRRAIRTGYHHRMTRGYHWPAAKQTSYLQLTIRQGVVAMPPHFTKHPYWPVRLKLQEDQCISTLVTATNSIEKTTVTLCFRGHRLWLDPATYQPYNGIAALSFVSSAQWASGQCYRKVTSRGYASFSGMQLCVQRKPLPTRKTTKATA